MALKLDISKAYDMVEWHFLKQIMKKIGFSKKWLELITGCITLVSFSSKERPKARLSLLPIFVYPLYISILKLIVSGIKEKIRGLKFTEDYTISHLLFIDDNLVFAIASVT